MVEVVRVVRRWGIGPCQCLCLRIWRSRFGRRCVVVVVVVVVVVCRLVTADGRSHLSSRSVRVGRWEEGGETVKVVETWYTG